MRLKTDKAITDLYNRAVKFFYKPIRKPIMNEANLKNISTKILLQELLNRGKRKRILSKDTPCRIEFDPRTCELVIGTEKEDYATIYLTQDKLDILKDF